MNKILILIAFVALGFTTGCEKEAKSRTATETFNLLVGSGAKVWTWTASRVNGQNVTLTACQQQTVHVYANTSQLQSRNYVTAAGGGCTQFNENGTFNVPNGNTITINIGGIIVTETFL